MTNIYMTNIYMRNIWQIIKSLFAGFHRNEKSKENYYNNKYPKKDIIYNGRYVPNSYEKVPIDIRNFFNPNDSMIKKIVDSLQLSHQSDDEKTLTCLTYILDNYKYVSDIEKGHNEFWQFPNETIYYKTGDCEDFSILLANMLLISGIPYWKVRLTAGSVDDGKIKGGHCFVVYYHEDKDRWVLLDTTYWPNRLEISDRKEYKDETFYKETWFSWNEKYCYSRDVKDIQKMEDVKFGNSDREGS